MIAKAGKAFSQIGAVALGFLMIAAGFAIFIGGPYLIARVFPVQAYHYAEIAFGIAVLVGIMALVAGIFKGARPVAGFVLFLASWVVFAFLWVWSVLVVDATWGLVTLYVANLFLAVGAVLVAFAAALFTGQWSVLWQIVVIGLIGIGMRVLGSHWAEMTGE